MKILHTADWHLGRGLQNFSFIEDQKYILNQIAEISKTKNVDIVVIAGDVFDRASPPAEAVELFDDILHRLVTEQGKTVIVVAGNHDSAERLSINNRILSKQNLHIAGSYKDKLLNLTLHDKHGEIIFYLFPYSEPSQYGYLTGNKDIHTHNDVFSDIAAEALKNNVGTRKVLIAHAFAVGGQISDTERALSVGGAEEVNSSHFDAFNYTALGHLHRRQEIRKGKVFYSGSILKYSLAEINHEKSVILADIDGAGAVEVEYVALKPKREMHSIKGKIDNDRFIAETDKIELSKEDILIVTLTNELPVTDAMRIIQEQYPYTVKLVWEKDKDYKAKDITFGANDVKQKTVMEIFEEFYKHCLGKEMEKEQRDYLFQTIKETEEDTK